MNRIFATGLALFICLGALTAGGPWPQKKGKGFFKLSEWWVVFDQHFNAEGELEPNIKEGVFNTSIYGE